MRLPIALAALGFAAAPAVHASPQILALLSTEGAVPLHCQGAVCSAELSAFCLERNRATPDAGTAYRAAPNAVLVLVVTAADGSVREIDARRLAEFASVRDMTAVRVTVDRRALGDAARIAIRSGSETALLPVHISRYGQMREKDDVERVTGQVRRSAQGVDRSAEAAVARDLTRTLDTLRNEDEKAAVLTAGAASPVVRHCTAKVAEEMARRKDTIGVRGHWTGRSIVGEPSLKSCLEQAHASLMLQLNLRFWNGDLPAPAAPKTPPRM